MLSAAIWQGKWWWWAVPARPVTEVSIGQQLGGVQTFGWMAMVPFNVRGSSSPLRKAHVRTS